MTAGDGPKRAPRGAPGSFREAKMINSSRRFSNNLSIRNFSSLYSVPDDHCGPKYRPETAQEARKRAPRRPKTASVAILAQVRLNL